MTRFCLLLLLFAVGWLSAGELTVAVLSDIHVSPGNENARLLPATIDEINAGDADVVVVTGDLTTHGSTVELNLAKSLLDGLKKPYWAIPGNHETNWSDNAALKFPELFGAERFAVVRNGVLLLGFSTGPYLKMGDGHVRAEDLAFLRESLKRYAADGTPVIVFCHYPLETELSNSVEVADALQGYRILGIVSGHTHQQWIQDIYGFNSIVCPAFTSWRPGPGYNLLFWDGNELLAKEKYTGKAELLDFKRKESIPLPEIRLGGELPPDTTLSVFRWDPASVYTGLAVSPDGSAYAYATSDGRLVILNADGSVRAETALKQPFYATPVFLNGERVLVGSITGELIGVDARSGKVVERRATPAPVTNQPLRTADAVYTGGGAGSFYKFDFNGVSQWQTDGEFGTLQGAPAVGENLVVFGAWDTNLYALNESDGKLRWRWNNGKSQVLFSPGNVTPVIAAGQVILVAPDRYMTALSAVDGRQVWRSNAYKFRESLGGSRDGVLAFAKTMDGELVAVETGKQDFVVRWVCDLGIGYEHTPCPVLEADGVVYASSRRGVIVAVDAATGRKLWSYQAGHSAANAFTAAPDGSVFFTLTDGTIGRIVRDKTAGN